MNAASNQENLNKVEFYNKIAKSGESRSFLPRQLLLLDFAVEHLKLIGNACDHRYT